MKFFVEPTQPINMAELRKVLGRCGRAMPEDPSVVEYCEGIMQVWLGERLAQSLEGSRMGERDRWREGERARARETES
jgi:hypothetical protein